jgi:hypothetical protein
MGQAIHHVLRQETRGQTGCFPLLTLWVIGLLFSAYSASPRLDFFFQLRQQV